MRTAGTSPAAQVNRTGRWESQAPYPDAATWDTWRGMRNTACDDFAGPDATDYYVDPSPATHAILTVLKAGFFCVRHVRE